MALRFENGSIKGLIIYAGADVDIPVPCTIVPRGKAGDGYMVDIVATERDFDVRKPELWTPGERRAYVRGYCMADSGSEPTIQDRYEQDEKL